MPKSYIIDMDGVIIRGNEMIAGADKFIARLEERGAKFLILTNTSLYTPNDLAHRLQRTGINVTADHIYTSALATAAFLKWQKPDATAFVLGESGLTEALHQVGYVLTDQQPDYVVIGETTSYNYQHITHAIHLVRAGARLIGTNPDALTPGNAGVEPSCGALCALIETATGVHPYFIGKPNPVMMRTALRALNEHSENAVMIGDRMDTDIRAGTEAGMETILVLTGVTTREMVTRFPYRPARVVDSVVDIVV